MPAKDIYHNNVKNALTKDKWIITHDPLTLKIGKKDLFVDLGAEKLLGAERQGQKIAVEIKSFIGASEVEDLKNALGQYILYQNILKLTESDRILYLAVRKYVFTELFEEEIGQVLLENKLLKLIIFDSEKEVIVEWIE